MTIFFDKLVLFEFEDCIKNFLQERLFIVFESILFIVFVCCF